MNSRVHACAWCALVLLLGPSGCGGGPDPQRSFDEAEELQLRYEKGASELALERYRDAMEGWKRNGETRNAARAGQRIADTYHQLGALEESLRNYVEALALSTQSDDRLLQTEIQSDVGSAHARIGNLDLALPECRAALASAQQLRGARETARALNCLGEVEYHRGNSKEALSFYRQAEPLWVGLSDRRGLAETLFFLGSTQADLTELDNANRYLQRASALWMDLGDERGLALTDYTLARLQYFPGKYQDALNRLIALRDRFHVAGDAIWEAACLSNIAYVYEEMGDTRNALRYWEDASRLFERAGLQMAVIEIFISIGTGHLATDVATAVTWFEKARARSQASGNQHMQSWALRSLGTAYLARGEPKTALRYLEQSLEIQRVVEDPRFRARTLADLGHTYDALGDRRRAAAYLKQSLDDSRTSRYRVGEAVALFGLARISAETNALTPARNYIESALNVAESLRTEVESREWRASYFASVHEYYELYVDVLMQLHRLNPERGLARAAFEASERGRARSLLDSLTEARVDIRKGIGQDLLGREQAVQLAFDRWAERQRRESNTYAAAERSLADEYRGLEDRFNQIQAEIRSKSPHYAALARPQALDLTAVQREVLDDETVLLEYALGEHRSYLWAVSNNDQTSYELPSRAVIEQAAQRVYEHMTARLTLTPVQEDYRSRLQRADAEYWQEAARLSQMLLTPVATRIAGKRILVVADGALQYVPFAALPVPGSKDTPVPMLVEHEIVSLPSASVLALLRRETRGRPSPDGIVAVMADPVFGLDDPRLYTANNATKRLGSYSSTEPASTPIDSNVTRALGAITGFMQNDKLVIPRLASTRQEADTIVGAARKELTFKATDFQASRATAMSPELARYRILHFATHGVFNNDDPGLSGIILSMFDEQGKPQDGFLRLHDIYNLQLPAELVVLSACETALGQPVRGEGMVGIVRGFMYAGAKRVVASLWKVDDRATVELMRHFYLEMLKQNRSPAAALRQAQLAMWQQDTWRQPFFWAAFALQGEWK